MTRYRGYLPSVRWPALLVKSSGQRKLASIKQLAKTYCCGAFENEETGFLQIRLGHGDGDIPADSSGFR
jgi:hypothetical protein